MQSDGEKLWKCFVLCAGRFVKILPAIQALANKLATFISLFDFFTHDTRIITCSGCIRIVVTVDLNLNVHTTHSNDILSMRKLSKQRHLLSVLDLDRVFDSSIAI